MSEPVDTSIVREGRPEKRWPMASAVVVSIVMQLALPDRHVLSPSFLFPLVEAVLLVVLLVGDPGRIDRTSRAMRVTTNAMIAAITTVNAAVAVRLVVDIVEDASVLTSARELLLAGGIVWLTNVIAFALWFWDLDGGGAAARASGAGPPSGFVFPEHNHGASQAAGWAPEFVDYLALSFNTAMAFSPTDVSAVRRWAKVLMMIESVVSLIVAILVVARAINILPG